MSHLHQNIDKSLSMITKKMNNIEQKVFATQKNIDQVNKSAISTGVRSSSTKNMDIAKSPIL